MRLLSCVLAILAMLALTACGADGGDVQRIEAWSVEVPYLPPPTLAARTPATRPRSTAQDAPSTIASGAPSDAEIAAELKQAFKGRSGGGGASIVNQASLTTGDLATSPPSAPAKVAAIINAGNQVARRPYVYGGGHGGGPEGVFTDTAYDCSGSVSYALAAAGFLQSPEDSTGLAHFGKPGPGRWVTIYANAGHAFMVVAGLRFDTVGRANHGSRWQAAPRNVQGYTVRHPAGL